MLTPAKIQAISDPIEEVYIHIVDELMVNIGKHLTSPTWTHTAAWEIQKLSEMGQLTQENAEIINKWIKQLPKEVRDAMEETRRLALEKIEKDMETAVRLGKLPEPLADSTVNVLNEYSQQAIGQKVWVLGADKQTSVTKIQGMTVEYAYGDEMTTWSQPVFEMLKGRLSCDHSAFDGTANPDSAHHYIKKFIDSDADVFCQTSTIDDNQRYVTLRHTYPAEG